MHSGTVRYLQATQKELNLSRFGKALHNREKEWNFFDAILESVSCSPEQFSFDARYENPAEHPLPHRTVYISQ